MLERAIRAALAPERLRELAGDVERHCSDRLVPYTALRGLEDSLLQRSYVKLGVTGRSELAGRTF